MEDRPFTLTRQQIAEFMPKPRQVKAWEAIQFYVNDNSDFIQGAKASQVVLLAPSSVFDNERILTASANITLTDGGPNAAITPDLSDTGVVAGTYGTASDTISATVDAKGRVSAVSVHALNTSNITEGSNLYFTQARARTSLSGGSGISYDNTSGVIAVDGTVVRADVGPTWTVATGTASRATFATYTAPVISTPPTQPEVQAIANALQALSQHMKALIDDLTANNALTS